VSADERVAGSSVTSDPTAWDEALQRLGGHLLQSWRWGEFKRRHGWDVRRVADADDAPVAMAQALLRRKGPVAIGYVPRGPAFDSAALDALRRTLRRLDATCRVERALYTLVEPDRPLPFSGRYRAEGFVKGGPHIQPGRTVKIPLLNDEALLRQMRQNTRYSVRLAQRRGVVVMRLGEGPTLDGFYQLLRETAERNDFGVHSLGYYRDFVATFGDDALCLFAHVEGNLAAALIAAKFGREAIYMYGASSTEHRAHGAAFLLQFEAMRWARDAGCERYDLWGIPAEDPDAVHEDGTRFAGTKGDDWRGLYRFKTGFGGEIVTYPPVLERRYRPLLAVAARRAIQWQRAL
jgi:lipid II:glycine glycyltransferase (peptidoglycan interpeptide bridge formation enzyme)